MEDMNIGSLSGLPFFVGLDRKSILDKINNSKYINEETAVMLYLHNYVLEHFNFHNNEYNKYDSESIEEFNKVFEVELIKYSIEVELHKFLFSIEDAEKIVFLSEKNQFNSKLLKLFLKKLISLTYHNEDKVGKELASILERDINKKINEVLNNKVKKEFKPLKDVVDKITSGVSVNCYLDIKKTYVKLHEVIPEELYEYVLDKYHYDFNKVYYSLYVTNTLFFIQKILERALLDNDEFWNKLNFSYSVCCFLKLVIKHNGIKHAQKIIDYIFKNLLDDEKYKYMIEKHYNLGLASLEVQDALIERCFNYTFGRFDGVINFDLTNEEKNNLLYPLRNYNALEYIKLGKEYFNEFTKDAYKEDYEKILDIFKDAETIIQENDHPNKRKLSLGIVLESSMFGYHSVGELNDGRNQEKEFYYDYYKFNETILDRFYYRVYLIKKYSGNLFNAALYEVLYDVLGILNDEYDFKCDYIHNTSIRDDKYNELKEKLKEFDLNISDDYKENYIVSLLDRKTATMKEIGMFSELEEIGDAIYELAVNNILFYQDDESIIKNEDVRKFIEAKKQIEISEYFGFDKLYISSFASINLNNKFDNSDTVHFSEDGKKMDRILLGSHNYIADSLEMIIGSVYKEFGAQKALDFATSLIIKSHSKYHMPVIKEYNEEDLIMNMADYNISKYFPSFSGVEKSDYYYYGLMNMEHALEKIFKVCVIGNETIEKRSNNRLVSFYEMLNRFPEAGYRATCYYLRYGIEKTIKFYKKILKKD